MERKDMKVDEGKKLNYTRPVLVKHGKLKDITSVRMGSPGGKGNTPLGCTRFFA